MAVYTPEPEYEWGELTLTLSAPLYRAWALMRICEWLRLYRKVNLW